VNWLEQLTRAMDYVEANLEGDIDYAAAARLAGCSSYNFQRMFGYIAGVSLAEYIRRRRMTLAGLALRQGAKVIDTALRFGYGSPVSFARAFREAHGVNPSRARRGKVVLRAYPRISFQITIKGDQPMNYRIEDKPAFRIFGIEGIFPGEEFPRNPHEFWDQCGQNGKLAQLMQDAGSPPSFVGPGRWKVNGACGFRCVSKDTFPYMLFAFEGQGSKTEGYTITEFPACAWALFPSEAQEPFVIDDVGVDLITEMCRRFYSEWLPASGYQLLEDVGDIEIYRGTPEQCRIELWFPIAKKSE
jgi:AraC family transcriptional regulator